MLFNWCSVENHEVVVIYSHHYVQCLDLMGSKATNWKQKKIFFYFFLAWVKDWTQKLFGQSLCGAIKAITPPREFILLLSGYAKYHFKTEKTVASFVQVCLLDADEKKTEICFVNCRTHWQKSWMNNGVKECCNNGQLLLRISFSGEDQCQNKFSHKPFWTQSSKLNSLTWSIFVHLTIIQFFYSATNSVSIWCPENGKWRGQRKR